MAREIKFRGKRIDNGEWMHDSLKENGGWMRGSLVVDNDGRHFILHDHVGFRTMVEVDPDTVGQYTGLEDTAGKEIYEGDIIRCSLPVEIIDNNLNSLDTETIHAKVVFENGCFMAEGRTVEYPWVLNGDKTILSWVCDITAYERYQTSLTVVGSIHTHPHLLQEQGERADE